VGYGIGAARTLIAAELLVIDRTAHAIPISVWPANIEAFAMRARRRGI
jgi:hypothetical protein